MEWGPQRKRLEEIEEEGGDTPAALENRPVLRLASSNMLFGCFMTLHMMRTSNGWGPNPLTIRDINDYEDRFGRLPIDNDLLLRILKQVDEAALEWIRKKTTKES